MDKPIRVLQVFSKMDLAGAESMIMNIYHNIDRSCIQFDFIVHTNEPAFFDDEIRKLGGKIYRIPQYTAVNHKKYIKEWNEFFDEHREYRIIHSHIRSTASIFLKVANNYGLITIVHSHNTSEGNGIKALGKRFLEIPLRTISDYQFACSIESGQWLFGQDIVRSEKFQVLQNAVDIEKYLYSDDNRKSIRKELGINNKLVIGHVGRFIEFKNHKFLIQIFLRILKKDDAVLLLVGDGELKESIQRICVNEGIEEKVIFMGNRSDVASILSAMDFFVFPSYYEGLPVALVEAQVNGLKCVVSDNITNEVNFGGLSYTSLEANAEEWASKVLNSKENKHNRYEFVNKIRESGFDVKQSAYQLQCFYERIV